MVQPSELCRGGEHTVHRPYMFTVYKSELDYSRSEPAV